MELLERESEAASLADFTCRNQEKRILIIEGPAGIGKSCLLREARSIAEFSAATVFSARCSEIERDFAYGVVRQLFEASLMRLSSSEQQNLLSGPARAVESLFFATPVHSTQISATDTSFSTLNGLYWLVSRLTENRTTLLIIDDLQWSDPASLRWIVYLLTRLEELDIRIVIGLRPDGIRSNDLLMEIYIDQLTVTSRPSPLSKEAIISLLEARLGSSVTPAFGAACYFETQGNPLLVNLLIGTLSDKSVAPVTENCALVSELGANAVAPLVNHRLHHLPSEAQTLARAVAVLGDDADLQFCAALAQIDHQAASRGAQQLADATILQPLHAHHGAIAPLRFMHPLVSAAVYAKLTATEKYEHHARAARMFADSQEDSERVAAHILRAPRVGEKWVMTALRDAALHALKGGAPEAAVNYLRRCLQEPMTNDERFEVLCEAGRASKHTNFAESAEFFEEALELSKDPNQRAWIAHMLGQTLISLMRGPEAVTVLEDAIEHLPPEDDDICRLLEADIAWAPLMHLDLQYLVDRLPEWEKLNPRDTVGSRSLDGILSLHETYRGDHAGIERARRCVADDLLIQEATGEGPLLMAWATLCAADSFTEVMRALNSAVAQANGSLTGLANAYAARSLGHFFCGDLSEAESDARESIHLMRLTQCSVLVMFPTGGLASALIEQGRLEEARTVVQEITLPKHEGAYGFFLNVLARLLRHEGRLEQALERSLECGRRFAPHGDNSSPLVAWRSEAALCLHALGRKSEARDLAEEDLMLMRRWGAARPLGRALYIAGQLQGGAKGLELLEESVATLEASPARLEYARALMHYGSAIRRANRSRAARDSLRHALDLASTCGAAHLAAVARSELNMAGGRPRRSALHGIEALTAGERRVAELASAGATNREISQKLFVTEKTVEAHLSSVYRKLGVQNRRGLISYELPHDS